jgi:hypothetical protein
MIVYLCSLYANSLKPVVDIDYSVDTTHSGGSRGGPPRPRPPMLARASLY